MSQCMEIISSPLPIQTGANKASWYSISQEICTRFLLCCALLWLYIDLFSISIRLTSLALWQSNDCPSASKATLMNMDKYFMWIHYERLHNHNKAKHNKTVCIFLGIYCMVREHSRNGNVRLSIVSLSRWLPFIITDQCKWSAYAGQRVLDAMQLWTKNEMM